MDLRPSATVLTTVSSSFIAFSLHQVVHPIVGLENNISSSTKDAGNMKSSTKFLLILIAMAIFDVIIPIPLAVLLLIYILYQKPAWFKEAIDDVYRS